MKRAKQISKKRRLAIKLGKGALFVGFNTTRPDSSWLKRARRNKASWLRKEVPFPTVAFVVATENTVEYFDLSTRRIYASFGLPEEVKP